MRLRLVTGLVLTLELCLLSRPISAQVQGQIGSTMSNVAPLANSTAGSKAGAAGVQPILGPVALPEDFSKLKIGPGFLLESSVTDEPDLASKLRVSEDGDVLIPLVGKIHVGGATLAEAKQKIEDAYRSSEILKDPQVNLDIAQFAPQIVTVLGEVHEPGRYQMQVPRSLLDVISYAGGETDLAGGEIQVQHDEGGHQEVSTYHYEHDSDGSSISKIILQDGDTITVPRAGIVYVLGAVMRPGGYLMQEDGRLDVAQALSLAMGTALAAKTTDMRIIRRKADGTYEVFPLDYQKMVKGKFVPPQLQAQDIVYVPLSHIKASLTSAATIAGQTGAAAIYTSHF